MIIRNDLPSFRGLAMRYPDFLCYIYNPASLGSPIDRSRYIDDVFPKVIKRCEKAKNNDLEKVELIMGKDIPKPPRKYLGTIKFREWLQEHKVSEKTELFRCVHVFVEYVKANFEPGKKETSDLPIQKMLQELTFTRAGFLMNYHFDEVGRAWLKDIVLPLPDEPVNGNLAFIPDPRAESAARRQQRDRSFTSLYHMISGYRAEDLNRHRSNFIVLNNRGLLPLLERFENRAAFTTTTAS